MPLPTLFRLPTYPHPTTHPNTHIHTYATKPHTHTQPPIQIHIFTYMPLPAPSYPTRIPLPASLASAPLPSLHIHTYPSLSASLASSLLPLVLPSCLLSCFFFFLFGYTSMVFLFSKQYIREIIVESQKIVEQVNSNYNNTSLALSCRHIYSKFINIFSNKNIVLFLTKYRHIH